MDLDNLPDAKLGAQVRQSMNATKAEKPKKAKAEVVVTAALDMDEPAFKIKVKALAQATGLSKKQAREVLAASR